MQSLRLSGLARMAAAARIVEQAKTAGVWEEFIAMAWQEKRDRISVRTRAALQAKRTRGESTNHPRLGERIGAVPLGARLAKDGVRLEEHPAETRALARARILRARGLPWRAVAERLESEHPRPAGLRWHPRSLMRAVEGRYRGTP